MSQLNIYQCDYCGVRHELAFRPSWATVKNAFGQSMDMCADCEYMVRNQPRSNGDV